MLIPCRVYSDTMTLYIAGLMDEISFKVRFSFLSAKSGLKIIFYFTKTYEALAYHVSQAAMNRQRMRTVSLWSLQMTASAALSALRNMVDPVSAHLKEVYLNSHPMRGLYETIPMGPDVNL